VVQDPARIGVIALNGQAGRGAAHLSSNFAAIPTSSHPKLRRTLLATTGRIGTLNNSRQSTDIPGMAILAWLFLRGNESVRIVRDPGVFVLRVEGPGYEREVHAFKTEAELAEFQQSYETRLRTDGWVLGASQERRSGRERRTNSRGLDRRRSTD
jgi:hypothetical protein